MNRRTSDESLSCSNSKIIRIPAVIASAAAADDDDDDDDDDVIDDDGDESVATSATSDSLRLYLIGPSTAFHMIKIGDSGPAAAPICGGDLLLLPYAYVHTY